MASLGNKTLSRNGMGSISRSSSRNGLHTAQSTGKSPAKHFQSGVKTFLQWRKIISRVSFILFLLGIWHLTLGPALTSSPSLGDPSLGSNSHAKYAYCTLLCDDVMAEAAAVMVHSVKRTGTPHDVVVLTLNVSNRTLDTLKILGAVVEPITTPVKYPFAVTADRLAINKPCRYSKLLMWKMTQYKKIVYLDSDLLIIQNLDELFSRPELTAAPDTLPPDKFNSGLMVLEPNVAVFKDMITKVATTISPNVGDQGFLNSYYHGWYKSGPDHHLGYTYNALVRISISPAWKQFIEPGLKVLHFSGGTKPWNTMVDKQFPTTRQFDWMWWQVYDDIYHTLGRTAMIRYRNDTSKLPAQLTAECQRDYMAYARGKIYKDKISVVMNCFDRFDLMVYNVRRYSSLDFVHKIYIVWGNTNIEPFAPSYFNVTKPVEILYSGIDSLNDRFKPIKSLETEGILLCDDDIEVSVPGLRVAFERFQESPYRLVGFFPRSHYREPDGNLIYVLRPKNEYSMVLTKMFLMHGDYLRSYTCSISQSIRDYVDFHKNCEDITMNFLVTQLSGLPPLLVEDPAKVDFGTTSGLSSRGSHDISRTACMNDIADQLGYMSLRNSSESVTYFDRDKAVVLSRRKRLATAVAGSFRPIFNPLEHQSSQQFMGRIPFLERRFYADLAVIPSDNIRGAVLCIQGDNVEKAFDTTTNRYALLTHGAIPDDASQISGTTFVIHSPQGFEGRFTVLNLLSSFLQWREDHGCFGPARVLLYHDGLLRTQLSPWALMIMRALLGPNAIPYMPSNGKTPECFDYAVVARQRDTMNSDDCNKDLHVMRKMIHSFCRSFPRKDAISILDHTDANVRVAFVGDTPNWAKMKWFNYTEVENMIAHECTDVGLSCQVAFVPRGEFCSVKVLGLSRADLVIGPWQDRSMDNVVFLKPGTAVLELMPPTVHEDDKKLAVKEMNCYSLKYDQMKNSAGLDQLLSWVSSQLDHIGRRGRRFREEEATSFLEQCVVRKLHF